MTERDLTPKRGPGRPKKDRYVPPVAPNAPDRPFDRDALLPPLDAPKIVGDLKGRRCKTCNLNERRPGLLEDVEARWAQGHSFQSLERFCGISAPALMNHFRGSAKLAPCARVTDAMREARARAIGDNEAEIVDGTSLADAIDARVESLMDRAEDLLSRVEDDENATGRDAAAMVTALKCVIELYAKLKGRIQAIEVNVVDSPTFMAFVGTIHSVLCNECREKVKRAMREMGGK